MYGLILSIVADIVSPIGVALQKKAHFAQIQYNHSPVWWLGLFIVIIAEIGNGIAYGDEQITTSAITAVGCVGVLVNAIISSYIFKEKLFCVNIIGGTLIVFGVLQVVFFAPRDNETKDISKFTSSPSRLESIITVCTVFFVFMIGIFVAKYYSRTGICGALWILPSSTIGAITVISARYAFTLILDYVKNQNDMLSDGAFYAAWTGILIGGAIQLGTFNRALALADMRVVVPTFYVMFTLIASTTSSIVYDEFGKGTLVEWMLFINSFILCTGGVVLLLYCPQPSKESTRTSIDIVVSRRIL